ncbi:MAG: ArsA family ATPase [Thermoanaerobaculia bacterium]|nr:ArsA family ATPase [Thermoanaerobaculia bacterium]
MARNAFFLGKGGTGKTTLSASLAVSLARAGRRVLAVSLDPAHNLGDLLGVPLGVEPAPVEERLLALEVDLGAWVERHLASSREELKATYAHASALNVDSLFDVLRFSPGTAEYAVLLAIEHVDRVLAPSYDVVVWDTPPTALSLRFLAMPSVSARWVAELRGLRERILGRRQAIVRVNPESAAAAGAVTPADDPVHARLGTMKERLERLQGLFARRSFLAVVVNADLLSVAEAARIAEALARLDISLSTVCRNERDGAGSPARLSLPLAGLPLVTAGHVPGALRTRDDLLRLDLAPLAARLLARPEVAR